MAGKAAGGAAGSSILSDKRVQIGVGVVFAIVAIVALVMMLTSNRGTTGAAVAPPAGSASIPGGPAGPGTGPPSADIPGGAGVEPPGMLTPGAMGGTGGAGAFGADPGAAGGFGAAPAAATSELRKGPAPAKGQNPFNPNPELKAVVDSVPDMAEQAPIPALYDEIGPRKPPIRELGEGLEGPPVPPMRVAGIVEGQQISAIMEIGAAWIQVTPGKMIPEGNPVYRVESVERDKVVLTRRWEIGDQKGVQRIEVALQSRDTGGAFPGAGGPGGGPPPGAFPGGAFPGGGGGRFPGSGGRPGAGG